MKSYRCKYFFWKPTSDHPLLRMRSVSTQGTVGVSGTAEAEVHPHQNLT